MRIIYIANALSIILSYLNIVILSPVVVDLICRDFKSIIPFVVASLIAKILSLILKYCVKGVKELENLNDIKKAEALQHLG